MPAAADARSIVQAGKGRMQRSEVLEQLAVIAFPAAVVHAVQGLDFPRYRPEVQQNVHRENLLI